MQIFAVTKSGNKVWVIGIYFSEFVVWYFQLISFVE